MQEHVNDEYVKRAQREGYRARAAYKLMEIDDRERLIRPGMTVVDLGAAPGSWSQVVVQRLRGQGRVIALDILEMQPLAGVHFIQGDFREQAALGQLEASLKGAYADLVIADMAPNITGVSAIDQASAAYLTELALDFGCAWLKPGGNLLVKVFAGSEFDRILKSMRQEFQRVATKKPRASRGRSNEVYLLASGRKAAA